MPGRRRRQAAKSYDADNEKRWANAIEIPFQKCCCFRRESVACGGIAPEPSSPPPPLREAAFLELAGFDSPTRTIFARIRRRRRRSVAKGAESNDTTDNDTKTGEPNHSVRNKDSCWRVEDLVGAIVRELSLRHEKDEKDERANGGTSDPTNATTTTTRLSAIESSESLLEIGSVWVLDPSDVDRPQNKPSWRRLLREDGEEPRAEPAESLFWFGERMTLRVHSRPSRYPVARHFRTALGEERTKQVPGSGNSDSGNGMLYGGIVHEEVVVGADPSSSGGRVTTTNTNADAATIRKTIFAVLHKPVGLPSHSTVDNAVENLLYQYQHHHRRQDHPVSNYASLPQRLDTETSGLLVVATHPSFARYFSRLLQQKTAGTATASKTPTRIPTIQKRYRCLVAVRNEELWDSFSIKYLQTGAVVEHFVDANSPAPKTFVETRGLDHVPFPSETAPPPAGTAANPTRWQLCRLRISSATGPFRAPHGTGSLRSSPADRPHFGCCFELEIELLTGRTHQIRGQLAALGCPIVGDPLYGTQATTTTNKKDWRNRSAIRMALQCCKLSFPVADDETGGTPRWLDFELDSAWWRNKNHH